MCSNSLARLFNPVMCFGFEDEPFGSEMCYGRGVCDTDPIPKHNIIKSCLIQNNKSIVTATISIEDISSHRYSVEGKKNEQPDIKRDNEIQRQFQKVLASLFQDPSKGRNNSCKEIKKMIKRNLVDDPCDDCSSEGSSTPKTPYPSVVSVNSPVENDYVFQDSKSSYKEPLKKELRVPVVIKPVGPFTEPPNPGNQMKLGEPYQAPSRLKKNFYEDF